MKVVFVGNGSTDEGFLKEQVDIMVSIVDGSISSILAELVRYKRKRFVRERTKIAIEDSTLFSAKQKKVMLELLMEGMPERWKEENQ